MSDYRPASRRPIGQVFRRTAHLPRSNRCVRPRHPSGPRFVLLDRGGGGGGLCFWQAGAVPGLLIPAVGFCYLRLWFNMLDGMVALASGKASLHRRDRQRTARPHFRRAHLRRRRPQRPVRPGRRLLGRHLRPARRLCRHARAGGRRAARIQRRHGQAVADGRAAHRGAGSRSGLLWWGDGDDPLRRPDGARLDVPGHRRLAASRRSWSGCVRIVRALQAEGARVPADRRDGG